MADGKTRVLRVLGKGTPEPSETRGRCGRWPGSGAGRPRRRQEGAGSSADIGGREVGDVEVEGDPEDRCSESERETEEAGHTGSWEENCVSDNEKILVILHPLFKVKL